MKLASKVVFEFREMKKAFDHMTNTEKAVVAGLVSEQLVWTLGAAYAVNEALHGGFPEMGKFAGAFVMHTALAGIGCNEMIHRGRARALWKSLENPSP